MFFVTLLILIVILQIDLSPISIVSIFLSFCFSLGSVFYGITPSFSCTSQAIIQPIFFQRYPQKLKHVIINILNDNLPTPYSYELKQEMFIWLIVSEGPIHCWLAPRLKQHDFKKSIADKSCSTYSIRKLRAKEDS